jgi:hypothetical protein
MDCFFFVSARTVDQLSRFSPTDLLRSSGERMNPPFGVL